MKLLATFLLGGLFGVGLIVSGMTQPSKVVGFLDIFGDWDPSLAFVMAGALAVNIPAYRRSLRLSKPLLGGAFHLPTAKSINGRLVLGAALFGVGWGVAGYCPGPAITSLGSFSLEPAAFVAAMVAGFWLQDVLSGLARRHAQSADDMTQPLA